MLKCIFSINPGRSGSHYLAVLLAGVRDVVPFHEEYPRMQGLPLILWNNGQQNSLREVFEKEKLPRINEVLNKDKIYAETNNAFVKGFGYLVMEHFAQEEVAVIILRRKLEDVVASLIAVGYLPHKETVEESWMISPDALTNITKPEGNTDEDLCRWYIREVYERGQKFQEEFPNVKYLNVDLEDLNSLDSVIRMIHTLGLEPLNFITDIIGKPTNTRDLYINEH